MEEKYKLGKWLGKNCLIFSLLYELKDIKHQNKYFKRRTIKIKSIWQTMLVCLPVIQF